MRKLFALGLVASLMLAGVVEGHAQIRRKATTLRGMTYGAESTTDLRDLRSIGANVVVYQLNIPGGADNASITEYRALLADRLSKLDPLVDLCGQIGLQMIIVLGTPPGGTASTANPPLQRVFDSKEFQDELFVTWQTISSRYLGKPGVVAFDLLNEPQQRSVGAGVLSWKDLAPQLIQTIHAIDPSRFIYIEPPYGNPDLLSSKTALVKDSLVGYNIHTYYPANFRTQGLNGRPINVVYPRKRLNKDALKKSVAKVVKYQKKNKVKILIGEFAAPRWAPNGSARRYLKDYIDIFQSNGWDWTLHAWREADVWSIELTEDPNNLLPSPTKTTRQLLIEKYFKSNR